MSMRESHGELFEGRKLRHEMKLKELSGKQRLNLAVGGGRDTRRAWSKYACEEVRLNQERLAKAVGISQTQLVRKKKKHEIEVANRKKVRLFFYRENISVRLM